MDEQRSDGNLRTERAGEGGRFAELTEKRDREGLSPEEADELGRMMAERAGKPYANAQTPPPEVEDERHGAGGDTPVA
jgi:hypothetical protein